MSLTVTGSFQSLCNSMLIEGKSRSDTIEALRQKAMERALSMGRDHSARQFAAVLIYASPIEPAITSRVVAACLDAIPLVEPVVFDEKPPIEPWPMLQTDEMVPFIHGGGMEHIRTFLGKMCKGYAKEAGGRGIFVTPSGKYSQGFEERTSFYALNEPVLFFQTPCIFRGRIPGSQLWRCNHNRYEVVVFPEAVDKIEGGSFEPLSSDMEKVKEVAESHFPLRPGFFSRGSFCSFASTVKESGIAKDDPELRAEVIRAIDSFAEKYLRS